MVDLDPVIFLQILHTGRIPALNGITLYAGSCNGFSQCFLTSLTGPV